MIVLDSRIKSIDRVVFSPDGATVAVTGGDRNPIELLSVSDPATRRTIPVRLDADLCSYCLTSAGLLIVAADTDVIAFDTGNGEETWRIEPETNFVVAGLDVTPDGEFMALGFLFEYLSDQGFQIWKLAGRKPPTRHTTARGSEGHMCRAVTILPPGNRIVMVEDRPSESLARLNVFSLAVRTIYTIKTDCLLIRRMTPSADGALLAALYRRTVLIWKTTFDHPPRKLTNDSRFDFTGIAFHPSGRFLAATSNDTTVKLYDTSTWTVAKTFTWNIGRLRSVAFSPDGLLAAAGSDTGKVVVWDVDG